MTMEVDAWQRRNAPIGGTTPREFLRNPQRRLRRFIERWIVRERAQDVGSILDVAANAGIEAFRLDAAGFRGRYIGIDTNGKALALAQRDLARPGCVDFVRAEARRLPFAGGAFDCVLVKDLLEHLDDYRGALAEAARAARRWLVVAFFIPPGRSERLRLHPGGYWLNRYGRREFFRSLASLGFEVERVKAVYRFWARDQVVIARRTLVDPPREAKGDS